MDRKYFLAHGNSEKIVRDFFELRHHRLKEADDLAKEVGGECAIVSYCMTGVAFDGEVPDGWRYKGYAKNVKYFVPLRKSKAGKELAKRMAAIKIPGASDLHSQFSNDGGHFGEGGGGFSFSIHYITAEISKGKAIISVPEGMEFVPPESTPLKMSEYWAIKEGDAA